jgi:hypothetical protein
MDTTAAPIDVAPPRTAVRRGRGADLVERLGLLGFLAIFGLVRARRSDALDLAVTVKLQRWSHPLLSRLMAAVSWPGFPPQSRIIPAIPVVALLLGRLPLEASAMIGAWGTALVATVVKAVMLRPRPMAGVDIRVIAAPLGGSRTSVCTASWRTSRIRSFDRCGCAASWSRRSSRWSRWSARAVSPWATTGSRT